MTVNYIQFQGTDGATSRGQDIIDQVATEITALSNHWTVVEDGYEGQSGYYRTVLKCASTGSGLTTDFFVVMFARPADSSYQRSLFITMCEEYDTSTHTLGKYVIGNHATGSDCANTNTSTTVLVSESSWHNSADVPAARMIPENNELFGLFVFDDGIYFSERNGGAQYYAGVYAGAFTSSVATPATNDPVPLGLFCYAYDGSSTASNSTNSINASANYLLGTYYRVFFTRWAMNPSTTANSNTSDPVKVGIASPLRPTEFFDGRVTDTDFDATDPYTSNAGFLAFPMAIVNKQRASNSGSSTDPYYGNQSVGVMRGTLKYILWGPGATWGDTITIGDEVYMYVTNSTSVPIWVLKEITA